MAEVVGLKRKLGQNEEDLGLVKKQLEANKGKRNPVHMSYRGKKVGDANKKHHGF